MEIIPLGDSALVVRLREQFEDAPEETLNEVLRVFQLLQRAAIPGVVELAPAYTSVAVFFDPVAVLKSNGAANGVFDELATRIRSTIVPASRRHPRRTAANAPRLIEIPICYDAEFGFDLDRVAEHTKLSAAPRRAAQRNSSRFGWNRRCANRDLSVAFSGRVEFDRPHTAEAFRSY